MLFKNKTSKHSITLIISIIFLLLFMFNNSINTISYSKSTSNNISNITTDNINNFTIYSPTNKLLLISTEKQRIYVFTGSSKNWSLEKEFICSTGLPGTETPTGTFSCNFRGDWFFSNKFNMGAKYYINFNDCYYIHSVPIYADQTTIAEPILGVPASHGCIRLSIDDSKWVYDNVPDFSTILIP